MSISGMLEQKRDYDAKHVRNYLTGNLCRCTGYQSIIESVLDIDTKDYVTVKQQYHSQEIHQDLLSTCQVSVALAHHQHQMLSPVSIEDAVSMLDQHQALKIYASATDLGVQYNKGHFDDQHVLSLQLIPELQAIECLQDSVKVGAMVSLTRVQNVVEHVLPEFAALLDIFASPQIKNNGTLVGNIANGSPIGDTLPFLMISEAELEIYSVDGMRRININTFYKGYKDFDLNPGEIIAYVHIPVNQNYLMRLYKVSQRRDLDISCVSAAYKMQFDQDDILTDVAIAYGGVGPTVLRMQEVEQQLSGQSKSQIFSQDNIEQVAQELSQRVAPLSDVRGSDDFRKKLVANLYRKFVYECTQQEKAS